MIGKGPVTPGVIHRLITYKDYAVKMVDSIIKETDLDLCAKQTLEDLEVSGLYNLSKVHSCLVMVLCAFSSFFS